MRPVEKSGTTRLVALGKGCSDADLLLWCTPLVEKSGRTLLEMLLVDGFVGSCGRVLGGFGASPTGANCRRRSRGIVDTATICKAPFYTDKNGSVGQVAMNVQVITPLLQL